MARRTKGVHIALIIFVVLCLILGVGVYMTYQKWDETLLVLGKSVQTSVTKDQEIASLQADVERLKQTIGCPANQRLEFIENLYAQDMDKYLGPDSFLFLEDDQSSVSASGNEAGAGDASDAADSDKADSKKDDKAGKTDKDKAGAPGAGGADKAAGNKAYNKIIGLLYDKIQGAKLLLTQQQDKIETLKKENYGRENKTNENLTAIIEKSKTKQQSLLKDTSAFISKRSEIANAKQKQYDELYSASEENEASVQDLHNKMGQKRKQINDLDQVVNTLDEAFISAQNKTLDKPDGIVLNCNLNSKMAIINLGSKLNLRPQTEFDVFPRDANSSNAGVTKGMLRVLRIVDGDNAECLIVKDETNNPIQIGDKIFAVRREIELEVNRGNGKGKNETVKVKIPTWTPGEKIKYAIAGKCDIDGDGSNDMQRLLNYIRMHGDEAPTYLDGTRQVGEISPNVRFLVLGEMPSEDDKAGTNAMESYRKQAKRYKIPEIKLPDLLNRIGVRERTANDQDSGNAGAGVGVKRGSDDRFRNRSGQRVIPRQN